MRTADSYISAGECNSITPSRLTRARDARGVTSVQLEEFGFFSGLRAKITTCIMLVRFDLTVLIGT
jgi:hypothetical protein